MSQAERIPVALQDKYNEIVAITDPFCAQYLTEEYRDLCRQMVGKLCRKRPPPILTGKANTWACGVLYALGRVNFLFDKSQQPHMRADVLCESFGLSPNTGSAKAKAIQDLLKISQVDVRWTLPSLLASHPTAWFIEVDGWVVDARQLPQDIQEEAFRRGLIPYVPE
jgi:hypothetical protein